MDSITSLIIINDHMTLIELTALLQAEGYNSDSHCIGDGWGRLADGFALDQCDGKFEWFYVERGQKSSVEATFDSEDEACQFAYKALSHNKWARSHLVGFFKQEEDAKAFVEKLAGQGINAESDRIPYGGLHDPRFRVFVYGKDVFQVEPILEK
jgi:hypothetical protein